MGLVAGGLGLMVMLSVMSGDAAFDKGHPAFGGGSRPSWYDQDVSGSISAPSRMTWNMSGLTQPTIATGSYQTASGTYFCHGFIYVTWGSPTVGDSFAVLTCESSAGASAWRLLITATATPGIALTLQYNAAGLWTSAASLTDVIPGSTWVFFEFSTNNNNAGSGSGALRIPGQTEQTWSGLTVTYDAECAPMPCRYGNTGKETSSPTVKFHSLVSNDSSGSGLTGFFTTLSGSTVQALSRDYDAYGYYPSADGGERDYTKFNGDGVNRSGMYCLVDDPENTRSIATPENTSIDGNDAADEAELIFNLPGVSPSTVDAVAVRIQHDAFDFPSEVYVKANGENYAFWNSTGAGGAKAAWFTGDNVGGNPLTIWFPMPNTPETSSAWTPSLLQGMTVKLRGVTAGVYLVSIEVLGDGLNRMTKNAGCRFSQTSPPIQQRSTLLRR